MRYLIQTALDAKPVLEHFNKFHDGFVKSAKVVSNNKFHQEMPWEPRRKYNSNSELLDDTGLSLDLPIGFFFQIIHHNYDWPNRLPSNQIDFYISKVTIEDSDFFSYVGKPLLNLDIRHKNGNQMLLVFEFELWSQKGVNSISVEAFSGDKIYIRER
jgi:hypothetical protein